MYALYYSIYGCLEENNTGTNIYQKLCKSVSMGLNPAFEQDQVFTEIQKNQELEKEKKHFKLENLQ